MLYLGASDILKAPFFIEKKQISNKKSKNWRDCCYLCASFLRT